MAYSNHDAYDRERHRRGVASSRSRLDDATFDAVARKLLALCPLQLQPEAVAYMANRSLLGDSIAAGWGALPPQGMAQAAVLNALLGQFGEDIVSNTGLALWTPIRRRARFQSPPHRLLIPYRNAAGQITTFIRRAIESHVGVKYKLTYGRGLPQTPYRVPGDTLKKKCLVVFARGAMETLALRRLGRWIWKRDVFVVGVPSASAIEGHWRHEWAELARGHSAIVAVSDQRRDPLADRIRHSLNAVTDDVTQVVPPKGQRDWAEYLRYVARLCAQPQVKQKAPLL